MASTVEALIGAVFKDSGESLRAVQIAMRGLGLLPKEEPENQVVVVKQAVPKKRDHRNRKIEALTVDVPTSTDYSADDEKSGVAL